MLLPIAEASLVCVLAAGFSSSAFVLNLLISAAGILYMLAHKWWFAAAFRGVFRAEVPLWEIGLLGVPFLIRLLLSWLLNGMDHGLFFFAQRHRVSSWRSPRASARRPCSEESPSQTACDTSGEDTDSHHSPCDFRRFRPVRTWAMSGEAAS